MWFAKCGSFVSGQDRGSRNVRCGAAGADQAAEKGLFLSPIFQKAVPQGLKPADRFAAFPGVAPPPAPAGKTCDGGRFSIFAERARTWTSAVQPVWRPALLSIAGDRRYPAAGNRRSVAEKRLDALTRNQAWSRQRATPPSRPVSLETISTFLGGLKSIFLVLPPPR